MLPATPETTSRPKCIPSKRSHAGILTPDSRYFSSNEVTDKYYTESVVVESVQGAQLQLNPILYDLHRGVRCSSMKRSVMFNKSVHFLWLQRRNQINRSRQVWILPREMDAPRHHPHRNPDFLRRRWFSCDPRTRIPSNRILSPPSPEQIAGSIYNSQTFTDNHRIVRLQLLS